MFDVTYSSPPCDDDAAVTNPVGGGGNGVSGGAEGTALLVEPLLARSSAGKGTAGRGARHTAKRLVQNFGKSSVKAGEERGGAFTATCGTFVSNKSSKTHNILLFINGIKSYFRGGTPFSRRC